jgi:acyl carrier protein
MIQSSTQIQKGIQEILVEALGVDEEEVTSEATLVGELGAESIDFLDIHFRLEKHFGISIPRDELFPQKLVSGQSGFLEGGRVTDAGLDALRLRLPFADIDCFSADPQVENIPDLFTVQLLVEVVSHKLALADTSRRQEVNDSFFS